MEESRHKRLITNTAMLYILQISGYIFPLLTFPLLTRVLQPENYGIMVFGNAVIAYFQTFVDFGFLLSATADCSLNRNDKNKLQTIVAGAIEAKLLISLVGFIILIVCCVLVPQFESVRLYLILSYLPVFTSVFLVDYLFRGVEEMKVITYRTIAAKAIYTCLIFLIIRKPEHYIWIPIISTIGSFAGIAWTWVYVKKDLGLKVRPVPLAHAWCSIKTSFQFFVSRMAARMYESTNTLFLGLAYSTEALASYGVANTLIMSIVTLFSPVADSLYPYMVQKRDFALVKKALLVLMPLVVLTSIGLYLLASPIIVLLSGSGYPEAPSYFKWMLPIVILALPNYLLGFPTLGAMGRMKQANDSVVFSAIFHIVCCAILYFTGNFDFISIIVLTCITWTLETIYRAVCVKKYWDKPMPGMLIEPAEEALEGNGGRIDASKD
ncbi:MAG: oligosaccharide flippase family protein [Actinobacteria bacterium]|nr:oligosaccharide flippase family protein [Actinomycetota bacterium]